MPTLTAVQWENLREYYSNMATTESSEKEKCLSKKSAAALAAENIAFFIEQCNDGLGLLDSAQERASNVTENTVKKYVTACGNYHKSVDDELKKLDNLSDRLLDIEEMYRKMAQNHADNVEECFSRAGICSNASIAASYTGYENENGEHVPGVASSEFLGTIKNEMDGVEWVA